MKSETIRGYQDLEVWKRGIVLVRKVYLATQSFPWNGIYGLVSQMRRCAISIPSNIAEGRTRQHVGEFVQFLFVALGSCWELDTQIVISVQLGYLDKRTEKELREEVDRIARMLRNLVKALRSPSRSRKPETECDRRRNHCHEECTQSDGRNQRRTLSRMQVMRDRVRRAAFEERQSRRGSFETPRSRPSVDVQQSAKGPFPLRCQHCRWRFALTLARPAPWRATLKPERC